MNMVNIFTRFQQKENNFTNALLAILSLSRWSNPGVVASFVGEILGIASKREITTFRVLRAIEGTADAEMCGEDCCLRFETKIVSGALNQAQIDRHVESLRQRPEVVRRLVLLTPDDTGSRYIQQLCSRDTRVIVHLAWKRVYNFLSRPVAIGVSCVFSELVRQFLEHIREEVFEQDFAGVIVKARFGEESGVHEDRYLTEMKEGTWTKWNTPREYKQLDGTGRKLLLYDRTRQGITAEVEIEEVKHTADEPGYPWSNSFAPGTLRFFEPSIPLSHIRSVAGFQNFAIHRKDRTPYRNVTHEHYRQLTAGLPTAEPTQTVHVRAPATTVSSGESPLPGR